MGAERPSAILSNSTPEAIRRLVVVCLMTATGCSAPVASSIRPLPDPPTIAHVGVPTDTQVGATVRYAFSDGKVIELAADAYRLLTPAGWSGELVVIGADDAGAFVASFSRQGGLPDDCFVDNASGREAGRYIEIRGVMWPKATTLVTPRPPYGGEYPTGTRFCFNHSAQISGVLLP